MLTSLGEATTTASEKAEGKDGAKIKALGKALTAAGKALTKMSN